VVLDPFCGVGSSCLAAVQEGRHFVGYEINAEYAGMATKRVKEFADKTFQEKK
jgi:site-specific DNA-methyltransferase (adenine-specific)